MRFFERGHSQQGPYTRTLYITSEHPETRPMDAKEKLDQTKGMYKERTLDMDQYLAMVRDVKSGADASTSACPNRP